MNPAPPRETFDELRRQVELVCDSDGSIRWCDACAEAFLGAKVGHKLPEYAAPGTHDKVQRLLSRGLGGKVVNFEVSLLVHGKPATLAFAAKPFEDGVALVGSLIPEDFGNALNKVNTAMHELGELHRETERQRHELSDRHAQLQRLNRELEDSNRGVVNLYAELDEKADSLRRTAEIKSRIVANVSHEFRTPISSISGLARVLLTETDGPLSEESRKQIGYILKSADELALLVTDLLDLAKLESGTLRLRTGKFDLKGMAGALRGTLKPLLSNPDVALVFDPIDPLTLDTDETKVAQIVRNLISNALKFTEKGEVRLTVTALENDRVRFEVSDTGIGIADEHLSRVFEEFTQIDSVLQRKVKGTGLGLSLSRRLAELLGGTLTATSTLGKGSTFTLEIPRVHPEVTEMDALVQRSRIGDDTRAPILVVEDDRQTLFLYEKYLRNSGFKVVPARTTDDARRLLEQLRPAAVVLDVMLDGETSWKFLEEIKETPATRDIPVLVVTVTDREQKARALGADEFWMKPMDQQWLLRRLQTLARTGPMERVLVIDDDEVSRYLIKRLLYGTHYQVTEAADGHEGLALARRIEPHVILLDFVMPGLGAFEVIDELKKDPRTRNIPVIIHSSKSFTDEERQRLSHETAAILNKQSLSREVAIGRIREALLNAGIGHSGN